MHRLDEIQQIRNRLIIIDRVKLDYETAHKMRDRLFIEFIKYVGDPTRMVGDERLREMANLIMEVENIKIDVYYS